MRAKLIIAGWLITLCLLSYSGEDLVIICILTASFCYASYLMIRYCREVIREVLIIERRAMRAAFRINELLNKCING